MQVELKEAKTITSSFHILAADCQTFGNIGRTLDIYTKEIYRYEQLRFNHRHET